MRVLYSYNDALLIAVYITCAIFVIALSALVVCCILIIILYNYCPCARQYDDLFTVGYVTQWLARILTMATALKTMTTSLEAYIICYCNVAGKSDTIFPCS